MSDLSGKDILSSDGKYPDRAKVAPAGVVAAAAELAQAVSPVLAAYGSRPAISSGYRTPEANKAAGGAPKSAHLEGKAVDFLDPKGTLAKWVLANIPILIRYGLWAEDPQYTKGWVHLQIRPIPGAVRIFKP